MPAAKKCPRCSAECICRKPRRKPRVGRAARSKPMYMPPPTQNIIFSPTPSVQQAQQYAPPPPLREIPSVRYDIATQVEATEPPSTGEAPLMTEVSRSRMTQTPAVERREMEVEAVPERREMEIQTDPEIIHLGGKKGTEMELGALRERVESGLEVLSLRPSKYLTRGLRETARRDTLAALPKFDEAAAAGGAAGGGGGAAAAARRMSVATAASDPRRPIVSSFAAIEYLRKGLGKSPVMTQIQQFVKAQKEGATPEEALASLKAPPK